MAVFLVADTIANAQLDAIETDTGASPLLKIWDGACPGTVGAADPGVLLVSMVLPADWAATASGRTKTLLGTWSTSAASANGTAASWCIYKADGTPKLRGDCGAGGSGASMILTSTTVVVGVAFQVTAMTLSR